MTCIWWLIVMMLMMLWDDLSCQMLNPTFFLCLSVSVTVILAGILVYVFVLHLRTSFMYLQSPSVSVWSYCQMSNCKFANCGSWFDVIGLRNCQAVVMWGFKCPVFVSADCPNHQMFCSQSSPSFSKVSLIMPCVTCLLQMSWWMLKWKGAMYFGNGLSDSIKGNCY